MFIHPKENLAKGQRRGGMLASRLWVGENVPYGLRVWVMIPPKREEVSASLGRVRFQGQQMRLGGGFAAEAEATWILTCCGAGSLRPLGEGLLEGARLARREGHWAGWGWGSERSDGRRGSECDQDTQAGGGISWKSPPRAQVGRAALMYLSHVVPRTHLFSSSPLKLWFQFLSWINYINFIVP